jgi:hypothetical protein
MKVLQLYENILIENGTNSCTAKFGQELFGQEFGGNEKDTPTEKSYAKLIGDFSSEHYGKALKNKFVQAMQTLKGCMSQYPEVLIPDSQPIYRGLTIPVSYFFEHHQPILTKEPFTYLYTAPNVVQSWTLNFDVASIFGNNMDINMLGQTMVEDGHNKNMDTARAFIESIRPQLATTMVPIVMVHKPNKNEFLFKAKYFSLLSNNPHEEELIRISNKPINVKAKFNDHSDVFITHDGMVLLNVISKMV